MSRRERREQVRRGRRNRPHALPTRRPTGHVFPTMMTRADGTQLPVEVEAPEEEPLPAVVLSENGVDLTVTGSRDFDPPDLLGPARPKRAPTPAEWTCPVCGQHSWWSWDDWGSRRWCNDFRCMGSGPMFDPAVGLIEPDG